MKWLFIVFVGMLSLITSPAYAAVSPPDNLNILEVRCFRDLLEAGDFLVILKYNIEYTTIPEETADRTFLIRMMTEDGTAELGLNLPYPYYDKGYQEGIASLYFPAAEAIAWGKPYKICLEGNPNVFPDPPLVSYILTQLDYSDEGLEEYLIKLALGLEHDWGITLTEFNEDAGRTFLNANGGNYFSHAVPNLKRMAPSIFSARLTEAEYTKKIWKKTYAEKLKSRYEGTIIKDSLKGISDWFQVSPSFIGGLLIAAACLGAIMIASWKFKAPNAGFLMSIPILIMGVVIGWVPMTVLFIFVFLIVLFLGYVFFFKHA